MSSQNIGAFSHSDLEKLLTAGRVEALSGFDTKHIGPASIDVTVSNGEAYRVDRLMRPSGKRQEIVRDMLSATMRAPTSVEPPGGNGTISVMTRFG